MAAKQLKNFVQHSLAVAALAGDLTLTWDSVAGWPTVGDFVIRLDNPALTLSEYVLCTSVNVGANQTTVTRAQEGTSGTAFPINSTGGNDLTAQMLIDAMVRLDTAASQTLTGPLVIPFAIGTAAAATSYGTVPIKFAETILGGNAASVTFSSIPATFRHLSGDVYGRGDTAATNASILLRLNNDAAANYDCERFYESGNATVAPIEGLGTTSMFVGDVPANTATANYFGGATFRLRHYAGTTGNKFVSTSGSFAYSNATGAQQLTAHAGKWRTTATAVNRIDLLPSAGNFVAGSLFTVWLEP